MTFHAQTTPWGIFMYPIFFFFCKNFIFFSKIFKLRPHFLYPSYGTKQIYSSFLFFCIYDISYEPALIIGVTQKRTLQKNGFVDGGSTTLLEGTCLLLYSFFTASLRDKDGAQYLTFIRSTKFVVQTVENFFIFIFIGGKLKT